MNYAEHIAAAESFLRGDEIASAEGLGMLAAEAIWGATAQVINAVRHAQNIRSHANNNRERRRLIDYMAVKYNEPEIADGFETVIRRLHNHFYGGHLSETDLAAYLATGRNFMATMLELAALEAAETERAERASDAEQSESDPDAALPS